MTTTIKTNNLRGVLAPLYHRYPRQTNAQPAFVEMDEDGIVTADSDGEIGGAIPFSVYHRRTIRWGVCNTIRGDVLADWLESDEARAMFQRVHDGQSIEWDGNNNVGRFDDDATEAKQEISDALDELGHEPGNTDAVWEVDQWLENDDIDSCWPVGHTLAEAVAHVKASADHENVELDGDVEQALLYKAERANDRNKCFRPEILLALHAANRHPYGPDGEEWTHEG